MWLLFTERGSGSEVGGWGVRSIGCSSHKTQSWARIEGEIRLTAHHGR